MNNVDLLQNNIFFKQNKDKFNPDVIEKKKNLENDFSINIFKNNTKLVYNGIIDTVPNEVKSSKDLEIPKDDPIIDYQQLINSKCKERSEQDTQLKPIKQKIIVDQSVEKNDVYSNMKEENKSFINNQNKIITNTKLNNILENLKDLGILE
jgi:hypothetical protein